MQANPITTKSIKKATSYLKRLAVQSPIFLCIGTMSVLADSIGPQVGTLLNANMSHPLTVYGATSNAITAQNLQQAYAFVKSMHPNSTIVVVDSAVGTPDQIGKVQIAPFGVQAGKATGKSFQPMGDISIVGIVANKNMKDFYTPTRRQQNTVDTLCRLISNSILQSLQV